MLSYISCKGYNESDNDAIRAPCAFHSMFLKGIAYVSIMTLVHFEKCNVLISSNNYYYTNVYYIGRKLTRCSCTLTHIILFKYDNNINNKNTWCSHTIIFQKSKQDVLFFRLNFVQAKYFSYNIIFFGMKYFRVLI